MAKWGLAMLGIGLFMAIAPSKGIGIVSGGFVWGALMCFLASGLERIGWRNTALVTFILSFVICLFGFVVRKPLDLIYLHNEGETIGGLNAIRSALSIRKGDLHGRSSQDLAELTKGQAYLRSIPVVKASNHHGDSSAVRYGILPDDGSGWLYDNVEGDPGFGTVRVNCTHNDSKGRAWTAY